MSADARTWAVQLAKPAECTPESVADLIRRGFTFDIKWDGVRALVIVEDGNLTLVNRNGVDITYRYPDLVTKVAGQFPGQSFVLDSEVVVFDPSTGVPRFKWIHQRDAFGPGRRLDIANWAASHPATIVAFDFLSGEGKDVRGIDQANRLHLLDQWVPTTLGPDGAITRSLRDTDGHVMMQLVAARNLEGLIAKDMKAVYRGGRTATWLKLKPTLTASVLVTGLDDNATGWRKDEGYFRALEIAVLGGATPCAEKACVLGAAEPHTHLGKVGSGFSRADLNLIDPVVRAGAEIVIEVRYQERQPDSGVLRFPTFLGMRTDVDRTACTVEQLEAS